jgi:PAS domain S-box-containing protein
MLQILLIDDSPQDRILAKRELERAFDQLHIIEVNQAEALEQAIEAGQFDITVTDYMLRWSDGITVLRNLKARYPDRPVVMFTNSGSQEIAVEAMKSGLDDYIIKAPSHYVRLPAAVRLALERATAHRKVAGLEARLQQLTNQLNVGVYRLSSKGVLLEANPAFMRLLGVNSAADLSLESYFNPDDYALLLSQLQQNGEARDREIELRRADGELIWVRISKTFTEVEGATLIDGLIEDITGRKQIELENQQLYQEAQQANRIKDEFLAIVSHELRTPLNSMLGWAQILKTRRFNSETLAKAIEVIERNARLQTKLINDLLDISRIIQNQLHLNRDVVDLIPVIQAAIDNIQLAAEAKAIELTVDLDPSVGQISGDAERLQQVVWNLLSNAVKFTSQGGQVTIRLARLSEPKWMESNADDRLAASAQIREYAQITVTDTGRGISSDFLPYVFERFRQADASKTRSQGGLGLGLAIARHLVALHDGKIEALSDGIGKGATFIVTLPLIIQSGIQSPVHRSSEPSELQVLQDQQILVVDDDPDTVELIRFVLQSYKAQVTGANSAPVALQHLSEVPFNLLISDIGMPGRDGYWLIQQLRQIHTEASQIPAIALTAFAQEEEKQRTLSAGFQAHIAKPVDPNELLHLIVHLIKKG